MESTSILNAISDDELLQRLATLLQGSRHTEADLVAHIGEVRRAPTLRPGSFAVRS